MGKAYGGLLKVAPEKRQGILNSEETRTRLSKGERDLLARMLALSGSRNRQDASKQPTIQKP